MPLTTKEILDNGVWPRVKMVFGYTNRKTPKTPASKLTELRAVYEAVNCRHIANFIEMIQFDEAVQKFAVSYNFSLVPCLPKDFKHNLSQEIDAELLQHDLLVGSRFGVECATSWLDAISKSDQDLDTDDMQIINKIFGSAIEAKTDISTTLQKGDLIDIANGFCWMQDFQTKRIQ